MYNKLNIKNLYFEEENIKEIEKISILKEINYKGPIFKVGNKDNPILLLQENFYEPNYDFLFITKNKNNYNANFVKVGVDISEDKIQNIIDDLIENNQYYKKNIIN